MVLGILFLIAMRIDPLAGQKNFPRGTLAGKSPMGRLFLNEPPFLPRETLTEGSPMQRHSRRGVANGMPFFWMSRPFCLERHSRRVVANGRSYIVLAA